MGLFGFLFGGKKRRGTRYYGNSEYGESKKDFEKNLKDDRKEGVETWWYENGEKKFEINWEDGRKEGLETQWYKNGEKKLEINWKYGRREGIELIWYRNLRTREIEWRDGVLISSISRDKNGHVLDKSKTKAIVIYYFSILIGMLVIWQQGNFNREEDVVFLFISSPFMAGGCFMLTALLLMCVKSIIGSIVKKFFDEEIPIFEDDWIDDNAYVLFVFSYISFLWFSVVSPFIS